jgi:hypothetical protein
VLASRRQGRTNGFAAAAAAVTVFVVGGAVLAGAPAPASLQRATKLRGRLDLMRADEGIALRGLDYGRRVRLNERQTLEMTSIRVTRSAGELSDDPRRLAGPFALPAGRFTARITFDRSTGGDSAALVFIDGGIQIARGTADSASPIAFELPVDAPVWIAVSNPSTASAAQAVEIVAESIVPRARARRGRGAGDRSDRPNGPAPSSSHRRRRMPGRRRVLDAAEPVPARCSSIPPARRRSCWCCMWGRSAASCA